MTSAIGVYIVLSLLTCKPPHNMDKLLHRGLCTVDPVTGDPLPPVERPPTS